MEILTAKEVLSSYSESWLKAKIVKNERDKTPQYEQDARNCWFYSVCNNAYFNL